MSQRRKKLAHSVTEEDTESYRFTHRMTTPELNPRVFYSDFDKLAVVVVYNYQIV